MRNGAELRRHALALEIPNGGDLLPRDDAVAAARGVEEENDLQRDLGVGDPQRVEQRRGEDVEAPLAECSVSVEIRAEPLDLDLRGLEEIELPGRIKGRVSR